MPEEPALPPPGPGPFDDPPVWPLHQRLRGVALRAALACVGGLPLALYVWVDEYRLRLSMEWLAVYVCFFMCGLLLFGTARRGSTWWSTSLRLAVAGLATPALAMLTFVWVDNLGSPGEAYEAIGKLARGRVLAPGLVLSLIFALFYPAAGLWFYVRNRTARLWAQVVAGALTLGLPAFCLFGMPRVKGLAFFLLVTAVLVPLAVWFGDRLARRFDPEAPEPTEASPRDLRLVFGLGGCLCWAALGGLMLPAYASIPSRGAQSSAAGSLRNLANAQSLFRESDKDHDADLDYAGSTLELGGVQVVDRLLGEGLKNGYVFRLMRGSAAPELTWSAAADPVRTEGLHFFVNHEGVIYTSERPIPLDPKEGKAPAGLPRYPGGWRY